MLHLCLYKGVAHAAFSVLVFNSVVDLCPLMDQHGFHIGTVVMWTLVTTNIGCSIKYYSFGIKHICLSAF